MLVITDFKLRVAGQNWRKKKKGFEAIYGYVTCLFIKFMSDTSLQKKCGNSAPIIVRYLVVIKTLMRPLFIEKTNLPETNLPVNC